jgi:hypothetical protein
VRQQSDNFNNLNMIPKLEVRRAGESVTLMPVVVSSTSPLHYGCTVTGTGVPAPPPLRGTVTAATRTRSLKRHNRDLIRNFKFKLNRLPELV